MLVASLYAIIFCYFIHQAVSRPTQLSLGKLHIGLLVSSSDEKAISRKYFSHRLKCQPTD